jgi:hypothetical protein
VANGRPGRKPVDRGLKPDGDPYSTTPKYRKWQEEYREKNKEVCSQRERQWRLNLSPEERLARKIAHKAYMAVWAKNKRNEAILAEMERNKRKVS